MDIHDIYIYNIVYNALHIHVLGAIPNLRLLTTKKIIKNINTSTPAMTIESAAATLMCEIMISMFIKKLKIPSLPDLIPILIYFSLIAHLCNDHLLFEYT